MSLKNCGMQVAELAKDALPAVFSLTPNKGTHYSWVDQDLLSRQVLTMICSDMRPATGTWASFTTAGACVFSHSAHPVWPQAVHQLTHPPATLS
jgi:hypothetical protein